MLPGEYGFDDDEHEAKLEALADMAAKNKTDMLLSQEDGAAPQQSEAPKPAFISYPDPETAPGPRMPAIQDWDWKRGVLTAFGSPADVQMYDRRQALQNPLSAESAEQKAQLDEFKAKSEERAFNRSLKDPNSDASKRAQAEYAAELSTYAKIPGIPAGIAAALADAQAESKRMSATEVARARLQTKSLIGTALHGAGVVAQETAAGMRAADMAHDNQLAEQIAHSNISHARSAEELAREKFEWEKNKPVQVKVKQPGENTLKDYRSRNPVINQTKEALSLLPQVRYTGLGAEGLNALFSKLPGKLDQRNDAERKLASTVNLLRAAARNKLFGAALSKYDIQDANSFLANLGNNPETLKTNLEIALRALQDLQEATEEQYPSISGDPMPGAGASAQTPPQNGQKLAPPGAKPGERYPNKKDGKIYVVQPDGTMLPE